MPDPPQSLSDLLQRQMEKSAQAKQSGDKTVLARYLDADVVFTNETGESATRDELLADPSAPTGLPIHNEIVVWRLRLQGEVATATFTDVVTRNLFGRVVEARFRSTEVWARCANGWRMIVSDTAYMPHDPPAIRIALSDLDAYVGACELAPGLRVSITCMGDNSVPARTARRQSL